KRILLCVGGRQPLTHDIGRYKTTTRPLDWIAAALLRTYVELGSRAAGVSAIRRQAHGSAECTLASVGSFFRFVGRTVPVKVTPQPCRSPAKARSDRYYWPLPPRTQVSYTPYHRIVDFLQYLRQ